MQTDSFVSDDYISWKRMDKVLSLNMLAQEFDEPFTGRTVRYIASDEVSPNEIAKALSHAIGKLDLQWNTISDEEFCMKITIGTSRNWARSRSTIL